MPGLAFAFTTTSTRWPGRHQHRVFDVAVVDRRGVARDDLLIVTVRVHRMELFARDVDPPNAKALAGTDVERACRRVLFAVEREVILRAALDLPRRDHLEKIVREAALNGARYRRLDDDRAVES